MKNYKIKSKSIFHRQPALSKVATINSVFSRIVIYVLAYLDFKNFVQIRLDHIPVVVVFF